MTELLSDRERLFNGEVIVFRAVPEVLALIAKADAMIQDAFAPRDPLTAQESLDPPAYRAACEALIGAFERDAEVAALYRAALAAVGVDPDATYWDRLRLRVQPHGESHASRRVFNLPPHRDTWGSNVRCQLNWWAPIYPVSANRTMALYPAYRERPVTNDSATWDLDVLRAHRRRGDTGYPLLPLATEPVDDSAACPVLIEPGDLLCFSGAQLHASVPNTSRVARFSTEVRTVHLDDLRQGRGAPNVDGAAPRRPLDWFRRIADGARLDAVLRERKAAPDSAIGVNGERR